MDIFCSKMISLKPIKLTQINVQLNSEFLHPKSNFKRWRNLKQTDKNELNLKAKNKMKEKIVKDFFANYE